MNVIASQRPSNAERDEYADDQAHEPEGQPGERLPDPDGEVNADQLGLHHPRAGGVDDLTVAEPDRLEAECERQRHHPERQTSEPERR